ncbi:MAG TPA: aldo/keto reductase [Actinomycetes bacterium]|nr:aldo/keto reductase [Actinomycetes bacterium]
MQRLRIGTSDVEISAIGLGGAWLGHDADDASQVTRANAVLHAADESGVNWVDTSENYFDTKNEAVIGAALQAMPGPFLVCSKAAPGAVHSGGGSGFRPEQIRRACENSLRRLGRDHLDIYLLHWPDRTGVPLEDTWGAMASLVDDGRVRTIGLSNYAQEDVARCHGERPVDLIQTGLSVIDYVDSRDMIAWCGRQGIAVTIYEPLAGGLLTDTSFEQVRQRWIGTPWEDLTVYPELMCLENAEVVRQIVGGLRRIADRVDASVAQVALAWVLHQPGVTSAIAGSSSPERARSNAGAADLNLPDDAWAMIEDQLVPLASQLAGRT